MFRRNLRKQPTAAFQTLLGLGTAQPPAPYQQICGAGNQRPKAPNATTQPFGLAESPDKQKRARGIGSASRQDAKGGRVWLRAFDRAT